MADSDEDDPLTEEDKRGFLERMFPNSILAQVYNSEDDGSDYTTDAEDDDDDDSDSVKGSGSSLEDDSMDEETDDDIMDI